MKLPDYILNPQKDSRTTKERKSTVKTYQAKFRSIGLEEATPLPKPVTKKSTDKTANSAIVKDSVKRLRYTNFVWLVRKFYYMYSSYLEFFLKLVNHFQHIKFRGQHSAFKKAETPNTFTLKNRNC